MHASQCGLQVWYSAGWTAGALRDFRSSIDALLKDQELLKTQSEDVKGWLQVWKDSKVPLSQARQKWHGVSHIWQLATSSAGTTTWPPYTLQSLGTLFPQLRGEQGAMAQLGRKRLQGR